MVMDVAATATGRDDRRCAVGGGGRFTLTSQRRRSLRREPPLSEQETTRPELSPSCGPAASWEAAEESFSLSPSCANVVTVDAPPATWFEVGGQVVLVSER